MEIAEALMGIFLSVLCFFLLQKWRNRSVSEKENHPPSPPKLPIIGNLHQLGKLPHRSFRKLSHKYGPVMFLRLGNIPTIVISSPEMAEQFLRTRDNCCCSRPSSPGAKLLSYNFLDLAFTPYSDHWKEMRKLFNADLLSPKRAESLWNAREAEVGRLINSISQSSPLQIDITEKIFHLVDGIVGDFAFGKNYEGKQFRNQNFRDILAEVMKVTQGFSAEDFFPTGGWIIDAISGLRGRGKNCFRNIDGFLQMVIDHHLDPTRPKPEQEDLVDVLLRFLKVPKGSFRFTNDHIKAMLMNAFIGGTNTSAITLEWTMSELMANPRVMKKLQAEVRDCVGSKPRVERNDLKNLRYLKMVIKETLRKHAPAPLLVPRETIDHFKIHSKSSGREYDIYPGTRILVNAWAIGRDPKIWKDPDVFYPERFEECEIEFYGKHFELLPFGSGKRVCPGADMGVTTVQFTLASLVYSFDWELPGGMKMEDLRLEEELSGITAGRKTPLCLVAKKYNGPQPVRARILC